MHVFTYNSTYSGTTSINTLESIFQMLLYVNTSWVFLFFFYFLQKVAKLPHFATCFPHLLYCEHLSMSLNLFRTVMFVSCCIVWLFIFSDFTAGYSEGFLSFTIIIHKEANVL